MTERWTWRDQVREAAIEPDLPIIDAHHHLWEVPRRARLEPYPPDAFFAELETSGHAVVATVYVDAFSNYRTDGPEQLRVIGETEFADSVAEEALCRGGPAAGVCAAIVGNGNLMLGAAVGEILDAHLAASQRFRGVRLMTLSDPDMPTGFPPHMMAEPAFRAGFAEIVKRGLSFDACVFQSQLADVTDLARAYPDARIVLDHIGSPLGIGRYAGRHEEAAAAWRIGMAELSTCPNVVVKIGGLNMEFTGLGVGNAAGRPLGSAELAARQRHHVLTTIDLFGPDRCLFESNFPVDRWYTSYTVLWNAFKRLTEDFGAAERAALFCGTAAQIYRIDRLAGPRAPALAEGLVA